MTTPELELTVYDKILLREMDAAFTGHNNCGAIIATLTRQQRDTQVECRIAWREAQRARRFARSLAWTVALLAGYIAVRELILWSAR